jgi:hypothetical protein
MKKWWKKHKYKILVGISLLFILIMAIYNDREGGTYSDSYYYIPSEPKHFKRPTFPHQSKGERECRRVMEQLFQRAFPSKRPLFMLNAITGKPLELDCCNEDMKLAVEYNGVQHYKYTKVFHKNYETFRLQQYRDEMKKRLCEQNNYTLIIVPYTIPIEKIEEFLITELKRLRILR